MIGKLLERWFGASGTVIGQLQELEVGLDAAATAQGLGGATAPVVTGRLLRAEVLPAPRRSDRLLPDGTLLQGMTCLQGAAPHGAMVATGAMHP